jgi:hypothetical protein
MGLLLAAKRVLVVGTIFLSTAYFGDTTNIGNTLSAPFRGEQRVEQGYANPNLVKIFTKKNENGTVAAYMSYGDGELKQELPLMQGKKGPRLGTYGYIVSNLTEEEEKQIFRSSWYGLPEEEKIDLVSETLEGFTGSTIDSFLSQQKKTELITEAWPQLDLSYRHSLVRKELDELLSK